MYISTSGKQSHMRIIIKDTLSKGRELRVYEKTIGKDRSRKDQLTLLTTPRQRINSGPRASLSTANQNKSTPLPCRPQLTGAPTARKRGGKPERSENLSPVVVNPPGQRPARQKAGEATQEHAKTPSCISAALVGNHFPPEQHHQQDRKTATHRRGRPNKRGRQQRLRRREQGSQATQGRENRTTHTARKARMTVGRRAHREGREGPKGADVGAQWEPETELGQAKERAQNETQRENREAGEAKKKSPGKEPEETQEQGTQPSATGAQERAKDA